ncbi:NPCBM/NEW2 domain-containing protein [Kitasatospora misakiensis]|uniref:NPCBM/NEW2 domain-containing protein n=1 Tax=Kitasatospora misakiensis TaxID=67330 RepID=A0ABW0XAY1_9ACTN
MSYAKGLGVNAFSEIVYYLGGSCSTLRTDVGIDAEAQGRGSLRLVVTDGGDGTTSDHADWAAPVLTC